MNNTGGEMDKKALVQKRMQHPLFKNLGKLDPEILKLFIDLYPETRSTLQEGLNLRAQHGFSQGDPYFVSGYDQNDIQFYMKFTDYDDPDYEFNERDYCYNSEPFSTGIRHIENIVGASICRLRYATLEPGAILDWHMDQPNIDRFVIVLQGSQRFEIERRKNVFHEIMQPGDVWYINSNWNHRVINEVKEKRLALLGCFDYNT